jgi:hypothetical protein
MTAFPTVDAFPGEPPKTVGSVLHSLSCDRILDDTDLL